MFDQLQMRDWRQFSEVDLRFHPTLTVLTGANASGKTTILNVLARHFGWNVPFVRTPRSWRKRWLAEFFDRFWSGRPVRWDLPEGSREVGHIRYASGKAAVLYDQDEQGPTFQLKVQHQQAVKGLHIPSHRPVPTYEAVSAIPAKPRTKQEAFNNYANELRSRYLSGRGTRSTTFHIKETLLSLAVGYGNEKIPRQPELVETFEGFERILRETLPESLGFEGIELDNPEVFLNTATGPIPLDAISGGVSSILDMSWQIYMYSPGDEGYVVIIDEPENHLHPALQRSLLGSLIAAFPQVQFIVATHSPFVVGSVPDSHVYVLDYDEGRVSSTFLELAEKSNSADAILKDVLGLPNTFPEWVEDELEAVVAQFTSEPLTGERLREMRAQLAARGLSGNLLNAIDETIRLRS